MKRQIFTVILLVSMVLSLVIIACTPTAPVPISTPIKTSIPQATTAPSQSALTPQDAEWNKVIEATKAEG